MSLTMALVQGYARGDERLIDRARQEAASISTMEMLESLLRLCQLPALADLGPQQMQAIEEELEVTAPSPQFATAVREVGRALLIERTQDAVTTALNTYGPPLLDSPSDQLRQMAIRLASITGAVCRRLDIGFDRG